MDYLHKDFQLNMGDTVQVKLDRQANVLLLDDPNYAKYRRGERHTYYGGLSKRSPVLMRVPRAGHWHVVIDLGGYGGTVSSDVSIIKEY